MAIICEDATPSGRDADADASDDFGKTGAETFKSAFAMGGLTEAGIRSTPMPIPSGYSFGSPKERSKPYEKGDLIRGRNPRWHLWADGVNVGKCIKVNGDEYRYRYNIFKAPNRPDGLPNLEEWQGYMTRSSKEPSFQIDSGGVMEFHNGVQTVCNENTANYPTSQGNVPYADYSVYVLSRAMGKVAFAIGNLIDWWAPEETPFPRTPGLRNYDNPASIIPIYGGGVILGTEAYIGDEKSNVPIVAVYQSETAALGPSSSQALVMKWQYGWSAPQVPLWRTLHANREFESYFLSYVMAHGTTSDEWEKEAQLSLNGEVVLLRAAGQMGDVNPEEKFIIHTSDVTGFKPAKAIGRTPKPRVVSTSFGDRPIYSRLVLKSDKCDTAGTHTIVTARSGDLSGNYPIFQSGYVDSVIRQFIVFPFYRINGSGQIITTSGLNKVYAIVQTFSTDSNGRIAMIDRVVTEASLWQNIEYGLTNRNDMGNGIARSYLPGTTTMYQDTQWNDPTHNVYVLCVEGGTPSEIRGLLSSDIMDRTTVVVDIRESAPATVTFFGKQGNSDTGVKFDVYNDTAPYKSVGTMRPYIETQIGSVSTGRIMFSNTDWTPDVGSDTYVTHLTFWKSNASGNYERLVSDFSDKLKIEGRLPGQTAWTPITHAIEAVTETIVTPSAAQDGTMIMETSAITYELKIQRVTQPIEIRIYVEA